MTSFTDFTDFRCAWQMTNSAGLSITMYQEKPLPATVEKAVLLCHGLQSHYELEFTAALVDTPCGSKEVEMNSEKSWARTLLNDMPGLTVFGIDHQGHGASDSWRGERTNVEHFDDYCKDVIMALNEISRRHPGVPVCLVGISLGGAIVARTLELAGRDPQFDVNLQACCLLAPAVSIEMLKAKTINKIAMPLAPLASRLVPGLRVGAVENHPKYPMIDVYKLSDRKSGQGKIPARLSAETIDICDVVFKDSEDIGRNNPNLSVHFIHAEADGFVDPQGSLNLYKKLDLKNKKLSMLPESSGMWHYLTLEPGTLEHVLSRVQDEIQAMTTSKL